MNASLATQLQQAGQWRLLERLRSLEPAERVALANQLSQIDPQFWRELTFTEHDAGDWQARAERAQAPPAIRLHDPAPRFSASEARLRGIEAIAAGKIGAVMVAGGQGTRLGFPHPKGMFPLGPVSGRTLFQIHVDRLRAVAKRCDARIPLLVMTSDATHAETARYFHDHNCFALPAPDFGLFCQKSLPAIDATTGELLFESPERLSLHPDGHGGMLPALAASGWLQAWRAAGIEHVFYFQVDNPLTPIADPTFIGYHLLAESELTTQVVAKRGPSERVGNVVSIDGRMEVIEYFELEKFPELAARTNDDGSLRLWAGNLAVHLFSLDFLQRAAASAGSLPLHRSRKKVRFLDDAGNWIEPATENAFKFERFIFDLLPLARRSLAVEVNRATHFAPVKNARGTDSVESSRQAISDLAREWLAAAGAQVAPEVPVEICPILALDMDELAARPLRGIAIQSATFLA